MVCPPVSGDNPRASASGLAPIQVDNHGIILYTYIIVDLGHLEIIRAKVGKCAIISLVRVYTGFTPHLCP